MYYCDNMHMSASLACGWVTGHGKELRAHAERRVCKNSNDEIDHGQSQSSRTDAVEDNQWHEQRLSLNYLSPTSPVSRVFRRRSTPTSKSTGQIQIQIRLQGVHVRGLCFVIRRTKPPSASCLVPCLAGVHHLLIAHDRLPTVPSTFLCTCILQLRRPFVTYHSAE
jgi:hypothetical protein